MVLKLDDKKTLFAGLLITLGTTILGGFILTTLLMSECRDVICQMQKNIDQGKLIFKWYKFEFFDWIPILIRLQAVKNDDWQAVRKSMLRTDLKFKYETLQKWLEKNKYSDKSKIQIQNYMQALRRSGLIE